MVQIIPFKRATIGLANYATFEPQKALDTLNRMIALSDLARACRTLKKPVKKLSIDIAIQYKQDAEDVDRKILDILGTLFPVDADYMTDYVQYDGGSIFDNVSMLPIVTEFVGWYTSWDEIHEAMEGDNDHGGFGQHMSIPIFVGAYMNNFNKEAWDFFSEYFGWKVPFPETGDGDRVEMEKVYQMIDASREIKFDRSFIEALCMDTGLVFFDWNPYSEEPDEPPYAWSYDTIINLAGQWKKAKKIVDRIDYNVKIGKDPEQLKLLLQTFRACEVKTR